MTPARVNELLVTAGAIFNGHFVGTNGDHLSVYIAKDRATRFPSVVSELCLGIAEIFAADDIDAVVSPAIGGIALSQWTAYHLTRLCPDRPEIMALYGEPDDTVLGEGKKYGYPISINLGVKSEQIVSASEGEKFILRKPNLILKRGFGADLYQKRILVVEDILTTGATTRKLVETVLEYKGIMIGVGALANSGRVTAKTCGVPHLYTLLTVKRRIFTEKDCAKHGLCADGIPINIDFGHGKEFLSRKKINE